MTPVERLVAVLGYHKIGDPPDEWWSWYYIPAEVFLAQLATLVDDGWEPIGADTFAGGLHSPELLPPKSLLITFDDGYASFRDEALACLASLRCPAVMFVPTDFVGGWNRFDEDVEPREKICDWAALRELERGGVSVQSHAVSHRALSELPLPEQEREALASKLLLERELESPVDLLSYPYGDAGDEQQLPRALARAGYKAAFTYGGGALRLPTDSPFLLPRLAMGPDTDVREELGASGDAPLG